MAFNVKIIPSFMSKDNRFRWIFTYEENKVEIIVNPDGTCFLNLTENGKLYGYVIIENELQARDFAKLYVMNPDG